jgi:HlyD family secretion protein
MTKLVIQERAEPDSSSVVALKRSIGYSPSPKTNATVKSIWARAWLHKWFILALILVAGLGAVPIVRWIVGPGVVVDRAMRGTLIQTVVASGHVETPFRVEIGSQITGTVEDVLVQEGQHVTLGQPLISLESRELKAAMIQEQGAVAQAEARMRQMKELTLPAAREALTQAQANLLNVKQTFDRTSELARNGYATKASLDAAQKDLNVGHTQVRTAELQVYTASEGGSDFVMAQTQLSQARANLDTAVSRLGYATISAPRDGVLIARNVERGTVVQPGRALLVLAPEGDIQLVLQIDERNLGMIALGEKALASADAYPSQKFAAVVSYINPGIDISRASVQVKLTASNPPPYLRQDMTVSVDIETARRDDALVLPLRSVRDALSDNPWVMSIRNGRAYKQPVKIGLRGNTQVELLNGLQDGDIAVPVTAVVVTGQRIRPLAP